MWSGWLEHEVVTSEIAFGMVHGRPYKGFQKILIMPVPITCPWNFLWSAKLLSRY
jgi:hypothetical protein